MPEVGSRTGKERQILTQHFVRRDNPIGRKRTAKGHGVGMGRIINTGQGRPTNSGKWARRRWRRVARPPMLGLTAGRIVWRPVRLLRVFWDGEELLQEPRDLMILQLKTK